MPGRRSHLLHRELRRLSRHRPPLAGCWLRRAHRRLTRTTGATSGSTPSTLSTLQRPAPCWPVREGGRQALQAQPKCAAPDAHAVGLEEQVQHEVDPQALAGVLARAVGGVDALAAQPAGQPAVSTIGATDHVAVQTATAEIARLQLDLVGDAVDDVDVGDAVRLGIRHDEVAGGSWSRRRSWVSALALALAAGLGALGIALPVAVLAASGACRTRLHDPQPPRALSALLLGEGGGAVEAHLRARRRRRRRGRGRGLALLALGLALALALAALLEGRASLSEGSVGLSGLLILVLLGKVLALDVHVIGLVLGDVVRELALVELGLEDVLLGAGVG
eukprot:15187049-Alexandrium_andersonii.AAC.1